ncbi:hypothetical protein ACSFC1_01185 [Pseudothermotoga sp. U03pept]|uniref:hypothetical protein n=1 Tax=Pseudothermotoga sp. U03pept TaxID=3447012 RepID=UPI003F0E419A
MELSANVIGIKYTPFLCRELKEYDLSDLEKALSESGSSVIKMGHNQQITLSWWRSPKRTRSYPYARVYDTLRFSGRKVTVIPFMKDEGIDGDRDFLQWDTVSLMSLLGVYTIIAYYNRAQKSSRYENKITNQRFDIDYVKEEINCLLSYHSDALHWNLSQIDKVSVIAQKALAAYKKISEELKVKMHSEESVVQRVDELSKGKESFKDLSRDLAKKAQDREVITVQPKEKLSGVKAALTITNYLGGRYFFTCDEVGIEGKTVYLIEGKHSKQKILPSLDDIKDGLVKMILYTNLREVKIDNACYYPVAVLKLTSDLKFSPDSLKKSHIDALRLLKEEAEKNNFQVFINNEDLEQLTL